MQFSFNNNDEYFSFNFKFNMSSLVGLHPMAYFLREVNQHLARTEINFNP